METNPNPILHFNERPGASPDYRFDYVETNINLTPPPPVARNKGFTRIDFGNCSNSSPHQILYIMQQLQNLVEKRTKKIKQTRTASFHDQIYVARIKCKINFWKAKNSSETFSSKLNWNEMKYWSVDLIAPMLVTNKGEKKRENEKRQNSCYSLSGCFCGSCLDR